MLTVDEIRKEMRRCGNLLPDKGDDDCFADPQTDDPREKVEKRRTKGRGGMDRVHGGRKEMRPIPEVITSRWIWMARTVELGEALRRAGVTEDLEGKSQTELRRMLGPLVSKKYQKRGELTAPPAKRALPKKKVGRKAPPPADPVRGEDHPRAVDPGMRLVKAETLACPCCGAQLMIERG